MRISTALMERLEALVRRDVRSDAIERTRHAIFISMRLIFVLCALVSVPPYLAIQGKPSPIDALVFSWALIPLLSVWIATRTGDLMKAHIASLAGFIGMATTLAVGAPDLSTAAMVWLILAPLDAIFAFSMPLILAAGAGVLLSVIGIAVLKSTQVAMTGVPLSDFTSYIVICLAVVYVCAMAMSAIHLNDVRRRSQQIGAARYESLAEAIGDLVLRMDRSGNVLFAGKASEHLIGRSPREINGRGLFERIHVADRPAFLKVSSDAMDSATTVSASLRIRVAHEGLQDDAQFESPVFRWFELRAHRVRVEDTESRQGGNEHILAVLRDIELSKRHEAEIEIARFDAETANKWKDRFLANVSHELRTPLNAIIGFSEILGNKDLIPSDPAKQVEYARIIHESGHHLLSVVNSILDISKIEAGSFDILPEPFEVRPLVDQCCEMLSLKAETNNISIVKNYPANMEELIADKRAFKQVIINLLSNAVKFTRTNGVVTVDVHAEGNSMVFEVSDNGIGIRSPDLARLGDPFFQARATYDRPYEGTGLGLSVVRGLVGLHGGNIRLESAPDVGTRVAVRFPLDCRAIARDSRTSAKIEAIPLKSRTGVDQFSSEAEMVKKIA